MDTNDNITTQDLLVAKGIILQSGEICQNKINLISGAMTTPLIETIWISAGQALCGCAVWKANI